MAVVRVNVLLAILPPATYGLMEPVELLGPFALLCAKACPQNKIPKAKQIALILILILMAIVPPQYLLNQMNRWLRLTSNQ